VALDRLVVHLAARKHFGERMADQLADAKLALRGAGRYVIALVVPGHDNKSLNSSCAGLHPRIHLFA